MHDLLWFCRSNFLDRPTLIFTRLSTSFLKNRTVLGGSFFMCGLKNFWHFPATDQIRARHRHVCLCTQIVANLGNWIFSLVTPQFVHHWDWLEKNVYLLKNTSDCFSWTFHLSSLPDEQLDDAVKKVKARHPAAGVMEVKAHLVIEGILVHRQRHIRDCLRRVASEAGPD